MEELFNYKECEDMCEKFNTCNFVAKGKEQFGKCYEKEEKCW
jgi:hypothetical protein